MSHAVIITVYRANKRTTHLCERLFELGAENIVVVEDGCSLNNSDFFNELVSIGCHIVKNKDNKGKGASLRTGIKYAYEHLYNISGFVTADADGQHRAEDIMRVSKALELRPDTLIIGKRVLRQTGAPLSIRIGKMLSSAYFRVVTGKRCSDAMTGLRGIPVSLYETAIHTSGDRFDYEMNFLTKCADLKIPFYNVNISPDYSFNEKSSYRIVKDTFLIFRTPLKFATASLGCTAIDLALFTLFFYLIPLSNILDHLHNTPLAESLYVIIATVLARLVSGGLNFVINRNVIFKNKSKANKQAVRFFILFFCIMIASSLIVSVLSFLPIPETLLKAITDLALWTVNYTVQRKWVFK